MCQASGFGHSGGDIHKERSTRRRTPALKDALAGVGRCRQVAPLNNRWTSLVASIQRCQVGRSRGREQGTRAGKGKACEDQSLGKRY